MTIFEISSKLYVTLFLLVNCGVFIFYCKFKQANELNGRRRFLIGVIMCVSMIPFPILAHLREKEKWRSLSFSGFVVDKMKTKQHALIEFTIEEPNQEMTKVLDRFWIMRDCEIGDRVKKIKGEDGLLIIK